eukprot:scaffold14482_cov157-Amphora_coffeaeformis.AAC.6
MLSNFRVAYLQLGRRGLRSRSFSVLSRNATEIASVREHLRAFGSEQATDTVTLELASESHSKELSKLGSSTAIITLKNPASRNALTGKMMAELADVVDQLETNPDFQRSLSSVIVRGDGGFFCAGADIRIAADHLLSKEGGKAMSTLMIDSLTRLRHLPYVTVAAIEGGAVGGGAELATATDYRVLDESASIRFVQALMGVSPGWGGATRLVRLVGRGRALELLGTASACTARTCQEIGLVTQTLPVEEMDQWLVTKLEGFVHAHPQVLHAAKQVVAGCEDLPTFEEAIANEHDVFLTLWDGEANRAALAAAKNKKKK